MDTKKYDVEYNLGESKEIAGLEVDYMKADVDGIELYAETAATDDCKSYDILLGEIVNQAIANEIDLNSLKFFF